MATYCTPAEITSQGNVAAGAGERGELAAVAAEDASRLIDAWCSRTFEKLSAETREYRPPSYARRTVRTGDLIRVTGVKTRINRHAPWTDLAEGDWGLIHPKAAGLPEGHPAEGIQVYADVPELPYRPPPETTVQITGDFGWAKVPAPVHRAAIIIGIKLLTQYSGPGYSDRLEETDPQTMFGSVSEVRRQLAPFKLLAAG